MMSPLEAIDKPVNITSPTSLPAYEPVRRTAAGLS